LKEDSIVGYVLLEIEFQDCFLGDIFDCDRDEVGLIELAAEIKILDVDVNVASIGAMIVLYAKSGINVSFGAVEIVLAAEGVELHLI
jgi:hypothetical protein